MFGGGPWELILILAIVIIIFGVGKLANVGGALGQSIREFRRASHDPDEPKQIPSTTAGSTTPPER